jgi:hypothetical protein
MSARLLEIGSRKLAAVTLSGLIVLGTCSTPTVAQFGVREVPPAVQFFRFKAKYIVKATGEVVQFDLVRPCRALYGVDILSGESVGLGPGKYDPNSYFFNNESFPKITSDHHAIMVRVPLACDGQTTADGSVPDDLLPFATWFDDADNFAYGWMYATEDAYKSPLATISFEGASIERANRDDFIAWQKHAGDHFKPSKIVASPLGLTYQERVDKHIPIHCRGVRRIPFAPEVREMARAVWPTDHPRYWSPPPAYSQSTGSQPQSKETMAANTFISATRGQDRPNHPIDGVDPGVFSWGADLGERLFGVPTRKSGDYFLKSARPPVFYPQTDMPTAKPYKTPSYFAARDLFLQIDPNPELYGFLACYDFGSYADPVFKALFGDYRNHRVFWRIGDDTVAGQPPTFSPFSDTSGSFIERDEFIFTPAVDPL